MPFSFVFNVAKKVANAIYAAPLNLILLELAGIQMHDDTVKRLIELGADINAADRMGETALHKAIKYNNLALVKYLCEHGADLEATNKFLEYEVTHNAMSGSIPSVTETVREEKSGGKTPLHYAALNNHYGTFSFKGPKPEIVQYLCDRGANPCARDEYGELPRQQYNVDPEVLWVLIEAENNAGFKASRITRRKFAVEIARSTYSNLKPSSEMAFPADMNSEYATSFAMGIISQLRSTKTEPNLIMSKILSYLPFSVSDIQIDTNEALKIVAGRNAFIAPIVDEPAPTLVIKRKADNDKTENDAKRQKMDLDNDLAVDNQDDVIDHKRKPEEQGGFSKRLRK